VVKIADFGLSRDMNDSDYYRMNNTKLPLPVKWMAIESINLKAVFNQKTDVWSFGILFWEIMTRGRAPYTGMDNHSVIAYVKNGKRLEKPEYCPEEIYSLMRQCWHSKPGSRPPFNAIANTLHTVLGNQGQVNDNYEQAL
jgi:serine/threonine protein kinase